ncbi:integrase, catalytic region, zinc finger, CCHC-type containing protein [Tanacetum coccineum]|uniref:Integrase, catalytic region, zinc finger, CCHC-type containing protein n=1 Tax=Tanacetum coccineum TaxID=301880 RepID=A0ABQ5H7L9_9ASTR
MSTSTTHQQSLADADSETRPPMLERGPYQFHMFIPDDSLESRMQTEDDLRGEELLHYEAEIKAMNLILISIPNEIYNSVDACSSAYAMWKRVEREELVSVYNRFAQLMNDLERNKMNFPRVTINTKFLNCLQPEWLKYVTQVRLAKRLTKDTFDDLFDYLQQFEKLVNASRAKKLEKSHDPLALVAHTGSSSRNTSSYYVTHPPSSNLCNVATCSSHFSAPTNNRLRTSSNTRNQAIIQGDRVNIQSKNSGNTTNVQCYNCGDKGHYARNCPKPRVWDLKYFMEQMMEEIEELSANICLMARTQPTNTTSDAGPSYDSAFVSEVQSSSINHNQEQMYPTHTKIINSTIGDDQIDSNIIFDEPNGNVNSRSVEDDTHVPDLYKLEQLARNTYQEAEKQQLFA